jgi:hypothetical protein
MKLRLRTEQCCAIEFIASLMIDFQKLENPLVGVDQLLAKI